MKLFLRGLPLDVTPQELHDFVVKVITPPWYRPFASRGTLKSCLLLRMKDLERDTLEYHGLLDIQPAQAAQAALQSLGDSRFREARVQVSKWQPRTGQEERRLPHRAAAPEESQERRQRDRRREQLVIDTIEPYVAPRCAGLKGFHRQLGD